MLHPQYETGLLWLVPWDPIYTPFTRQEMLDLVLADERHAKTSTRISARANWVHPEDPLNRVQHYNFWDVLQESLNRRLLVSRDQSMVDDKLVSEVVDFISQTVDQVNENSIQPSVLGVRITCAARIHQVLLGIKADVLASDILSKPHVWSLSKEGLETLTLLLQEALDLISRVELLLYQCHPEFD